MVVIAKALGITLHPWQIHAAEVAGELIPDPDTGQLTHSYDQIVLSCPRRAGKSLLILLMLLRLMLSGKGQRGWYTAQTRFDAAMTLRDEWTPMIQSSPLGAYVTPRLSNGSEALMIPRLASAARVFAPTPASLHGQAGDLIVFDEAWCHTAARGAEFEIAARPLMATRPGAQTWITSAAGDSDSAWWIDWLERGRAAAKADTGTGICCLDWTADAPGLDYADPEVWLSTHPALRHKGHPTGTIPMRFLHGEYARDPEKFVRLYLNVTDRAGAAATPFDVETWDGLGATWKRKGTITLGLDASPDQASAAIVACGKIRSAPIVEVVDHRSGIGWVVPRVIQLLDRYDIEAVLLDPVAPIGAIAAPLIAAGVPVRELQLRDVTAAAAQFAEAIATATIRHVPHPALDAALRGARRRHIGDGSWAIGRTTSDVDVCSLVAASWARYGHPDVNASAPGVY